MNDFDKQFVLVFCNFFLITELQNKNCDKQNHVNFKYTQFSKEDVVQHSMYSDLLIGKMCS